MRRGTILFTTGNAFITRNPQRAGVGVSFSGEVAYAEMLHKALADEGIHVAHTAIHGGIGPGKDFDPGAVFNCSSLAASAAAPALPGVGHAIAAYLGRRRARVIGLRAPRSENALALTT